MNKPSLFAILAGALLLGACSHDDDAGQGHDGESTHAEDHASPALTAAPDDHGHGHGGGISVTHFTAATELFVEYPPLVSGEDAAFAAHLTWLGELFNAVNEGTLVVTLTGEGGEDGRAEAEVSATPGIFRPVLKPGSAGKRRLRLMLRLADRTYEHDLGEVDVYPDAPTAAAALPADVENAEAISFTKEQQWKLDFAHVPAATRELRESVAATAVIRPAAAREALVVSPAAGILDTTGAGFPHIGMPVEAGQVLMTVMPRLATGVDLATLEADVQRARIQVEQATQTARRLRELVEAEAIAASRALAAEHAERLAMTELRASERRIGTARGQGGGIPLRAPLVGTVVDVRTTRGAAVLEGQALVHVADLRQLWLQADIPEAELGRITSPAGVFFRLDGAEEARVLELEGATRLVAFGGLVDPKTRTVPAIFEFDNSDGALRAGVRLQARVFSGHSLREVAVPASAIVDDNGQSVVFVMLDGESFIRRVVRTGVRDGEWVGIDSGVAAGERVVTKGAYQVRLAATAPAAMGHGHAH